MWVICVIYVRTTCIYQQLETAMTRSHSATGGVRGYLGDMAPAEMLLGWDTSDLTF